VLCGMAKGLAWIVVVGILAVDDWTPTRFCW
jgi:hypothetical protein